MYVDSIRNTHNLPYVDTFNIHVSLSVTSWKIRSVHKPTHNHVYLLDRSCTPPQTQGFDLFCFLPTTLPSLLRERRPSHAKRAAWDTARLALLFRPGRDGDQIRRDYTRYHDVSQYTQKRREGRKSPHHAKGHKAPASRTNKRPTACDWLGLSFQPAGGSPARPLYEMECVHRQQRRSRLCRPPPSPAPPLSPPPLTASSSIQHQTNVGRGA